MNHDYDVIVIGGGSPGEHGAGALAAGGLRVAPVERELVGGECSYWACIPSKALLRPGEAVQAAGDVGARAEVDVEAALAWRDLMVSEYSDAGQERWLADNGIELLRGSGRLAGTGVVEVDGARHTAEHVVIACGADPIIPSIPGLRELDGIWTSREATSMKEVPHRLLVLGAGPGPRVDGIGLETVGIEVGGQGIPVDAQLRAGERLWAIGDVTGIWPLTHVGKYQGRVVAANILGEPRDAHCEAVPRVTYTDPQAAAVGATKPPSTPRCRCPRWPRPPPTRTRTLDVLADTIQPFPTFSEIYLLAVTALRREVAAGREPAAASRPRPEPPGTPLHDTADMLVSATGGPGHKPAVLPGSSASGGGVSEGFELAEQDLIEHASHGDELSTCRTIRDAGTLDEADSDAVYGEADGDTVRTERTAGEATAGHDARRRWRHGSR